MRAPSTALLLLAVLAAGCALPSDEAEATGPDANDPDLISVASRDLDAPPAPTCAPPDAARVVSARFDVPAGARWARVETTFASGKIGEDVTREDGTRIGYASGASPIVIVLDEPLLADARSIVVSPFACDDTPETPVRVFGTFRRAPPSS